MSQRKILHIDMNSFFATTEQQANPFLRGKPIAVRGSKSERTIIVASSIEAKKLGIKTGHLVCEAKEICPEIKIVVGEPKKYSHILKMLVNIFEYYSDTVEIFSIDECFLDVTNSEKLFAEKRRKNRDQVPIQIKDSNITKSNLGFNSQSLNWLDAINIANLIKSDIKREIGEWMTCSIGIAENKFLAKLGSDLQKPDGLVLITQSIKDKMQKNLIRGADPSSRLTTMTVDEALLSSRLSDFCGIGKKIEKRLFRIGIKTVADLREASNWELQREFGIYGFKMKNWAYGIDNLPVISHHLQKEAKSFSRAKTLNKDVTSKEELKKELYFLCEVLGLRIRKEGYWGSVVGLHLRYSSFSGVNKDKKIGRWVCDSYEIFKYAERILDGIELRQTVRQIGISVSGVQPKRNVPHLIFEEEKINEKIVSIIDAVNHKYGDLSLVRASVCNMKSKEVISGMGRKNTKFL